MLEPALGSRALAFCPMPAFPQATTLGRIVCGSVNLARQRPLLWTIVARQRHSRFGSQLRPRAHEMTKKSFPRNIIQRCIQGYAVAKNLPEYFAQHFTIGLLSFLRCGGAQTCGHTPTNCANALPHKRHKHAPECIGAGKYDAASQPAPSPTHFHTSRPLLQ